MKLTLAKTLINSHDIYVIAMKLKKALKIMLWAAYL